MCIAGTHTHLLVSKKATVLPQLSEPLLFEHLVIQTVELTALLEYFV